MARTRSQTGGTKTTSQQKSAPASVSRRTVAQQEKRKAQEQAENSSVAPKRSPVQKTRPSSKDTKKSYGIPMNPKPLNPTREYGSILPICYTALNGIGKPLEQRPLGQLPPHIITTLNDHYIQLSRGLMVPDADLYNNGDHPEEQMFPSVLDQKVYDRFIREVGGKNSSPQCSTSSSASGSGSGPGSRSTPGVNPYCAQHLVHGEIIGNFVIYGSGAVTRAVCSKTREMFTAHVLPDWKVPKVIDVMQRLQIRRDTTPSADEIRLSELCVSKRTEVIKCNDRYVIFNTCEANTLHHYCVERLDQITEKEAMEIFTKIVEIVKFCHSRKVLIRNFKTRNFYLKKGKDGEWIVRPCFLQDMVCQEDQTEGPNTRRAVCMPFMAPEMLTADVKTLHSHDTEVWALGVLLYILLTGKYPFHEKTIPLLFRSIKFKQHRWPLNFVSEKSRNIVNRLMKKSPSARMNLKTLWNEIKCENPEYPEVRCRSNLLLKQQDFIVKMNMFEMYWNAYKDRLLPKNVNPINEELQAHLRDFPRATELAKADLEIIEESVRQHIRKRQTGFQKLIIELRLEQINRVISSKEIEEARKQNRRTLPITLQAKDVALELLLPTSIYPPPRDYHPSHDAKDWLIYTALRDAGALEFPTVRKGNMLKSYPAPVFKGIDRSVSSR